MISFSLQLDCNPLAHRLTLLGKDKIRMTVSLHATLDIESIYYEKSIWRICEYKVYLLNRDHTNWRGWGQLGKNSSALSQHPMEKRETTIHSYSHLLSQ